MALSSFLVAVGRRSPWWWLSLLAVLAGIGLRVWQWALGTSLFIDELALVHNVATRSAWQLVSEPLADAQVAPPLFLLAEQACLTLLGPSELSLRLLPLLASILALLLLWRVAARLLWAPLVPAALLALAVGYTFIYYSNQAKPYASDVAATLLVLHLAWPLLTEAAPKRLVLRGIAGALLPFYSHPAVLVLAGCGAALVAATWRAPCRAHRRAVWAVVAAWALGCAGSVLLARHLLLPATSAYMQFYWQAGMLPLSAQLPRALYTVLAQRLRYALYWPSPEAIWLAAAAGGLLALGRQRRYGVAGLLVAPWLVAGAASLLHLFPLHERQVDYLLPALLLLVFTGLGALARCIYRRYRPAGLLAALLASLLPLNALRYQALPPYRTLEAKPLLAWLARLRRPGDLVYGSIGAGQSLRWYGPHYGLGPGSYQLAPCLPRVPGTNRQRLHQLDALRGHRVWVVQLFMHHYEWTTIVPYLDSIGHAGPQLVAPSRLPEGYVSGAARVQLFDLTDPVRARRYSADSFPAAPDVVDGPTERQWQCTPPVVLP